ncbi:kinase-like domain-containing protein [Lipomyces japonicus]|uniref:kinase-like domain-containing protein n=1 Tax=Lipomyces japonicus TaxID=56871 RepID=UPI0034CE0D59
MTSALASLHQAVEARQRKRPTWEEFYRNGYPTDIITIEDDTPPPITSESLTVSMSGNSGVSPSVLAQSSSSGGLPASAASVNHTAVVSSNNQAAVGAQLPAMTARLPSRLQLQQQYGLDHSTGATPVDSSIRDIDGIMSSAYYASGSSATSLSSSTITTSLTSKRRKYEDLSTENFSRQSNIEIISSGLLKRRRIEFLPPKKPIVKATEVVVQLIHDPFFPKGNLAKLDDNDGHYNVVPDTDFTSRYKIIKQLGQGTFGKVVAAYDRERRTYCAIKIIRAIQKYRDASKIELRVLRTLSMHDKNNINRCIHFRDCFDYHNHICIVTDLLSISVFDFLNSNGFVPFPSSHIQRFAKQLFRSVAFLRELNLIHTDIKPENILLVDSSHSTQPYSYGKRSATRKVLNDTTIHLIDFGSATFQDEYHSSVVSTRHYRAPEIILGMPWSFPCDVWSIGCILVEVFTGQALFQTHDNAEHLAMMEVVTNMPFDRSISKLANRQGAKYFLKNGRLDFPNAQTTKTSKKYVCAMKSLEQIINPQDNFHAQFLDLLKRIFVYHPGDRLTAREALDHPWFRENYPDDGSASGGDI